MNLNKKIQKYVTKNKITRIYFHNTIDNYFKLKCLYLNKNNILYGGVGKETADFSGIYHLLQHGKIIKFDEIIVPENVYIILPACCGLQNYTPENIESVTQTFLSNIDAQTFIADKKTYFIYKPGNIICNINLNYRIDFDPQPSLSMSPIDNQTQFNKYKIIASEHINILYFDENIIISNDDITIGIKLLDIQTKELRKSKDQYLFGIYTDNSNTELKTNIMPDIFLNNMYKILFYWCLVKFYISFDKNAIISHMEQLDINLDVINIHLVCLQNILNDINETMTQTKHETLINMFFTHIPSILELNFDCNNIDPFYSKIVKHILIKSHVIFFMDHIYTITNSYDNHFIFLISQIIKFKKQSKIYDIYAKLIYIIEKKDIILNKRVIPIIKFIYRIHFNNLIEKSFLLQMIHDNIDTLSLRNYIDYLKKYSGIGIADKPIAIFNHSCQSFTQSVCELSECLSIQNKRIKYAPTFKTNDMQFLIRAYELLKCDHLSLINEIEDSDDQFIYNILTKSTGINKYVIVAIINYIKKEYNELYTHIITYSHTHNKTTSGLVPIPISNPTEFILIYFNDYMNFMYSRLTLYEQNQLIKKVENI